MKGVEVFFEAIYLSLPHRFVPDTPCVREDLKCEVCIMPESFVCLEEVNRSIAVWECGLKVESGRYDWDLTVWRHGCRMSVGDMVSTFNPVASIRVLPTPWMSCLIIEHKASQAVEFDRIDKVCAALDWQIWVCVALDWQILVCVPLDDLCWEPGLTAWEIQRHLIRKGMQ